MREHGKVGGGDSQEKCVRKSSNGDRLKKDPKRKERGKEESEQSHRHAYYAGLLMDISMKTAFSQHCCSHLLA